MIKRVKEIIRREAEAIQNIPINENIIEAVDIIYKASKLKHGKVVTSGMGKAGQIALNISTTLSSTGIPAAFLHPSDAQHGDLGILQENDVLLLISNSGKTREIIELLDLAKNLYPAIKIIVITGNPDGPLSKLAEICIHTGGPDEVCPLGLTPTTSTTVMTVIGDILVVLLMKKTEFSAQDYAKRHHGGYLGEKSKSIR